MKYKLRLRTYFFRTLALFLLLLSATVWSNPTTTALEHSTIQLLQFNQSTHGKKPSISEDEHILKVAKARKKVFLEALKTNPAQVKKYLLPSTVSANLPQKVKPYIEKEVTDIEGTLEIYIADYFNTAETQYLLKTADNEKYYLYFSDQPTANLKSGEEIKVSHGYLMPSDDNVNNVIVTADDVVIIKDVETHAIPTAFGPQKTIVMLVNFQDRPNDKPFTPTRVHTSVFTNLSNKYHEFSYQQTTIVGDVAGWFTVAMNSTASCNTLLNQLANLARNATTAAGYDLSKYNRQLIIFPLFNGCGWGGYSSIGGAPSVSYINGSDSPSITSHELGHALGIYHSRSLICNGTVNTGTCSRDEYGNLADSMGNPWNYNGPHFNSFQKERLGWLNYQVSPPLRLVTTSGTYPIDVYETTNQNVKAIKVLKSVASNGSNNYYYLEFRQGVGHDSSLGTCSSCDYTKGVLITQGNDANGDTSELLDMSPTDNNRNLTTLLPGKSFTDPNTPNGPLTITTNSVGSSGANVTITVGNTPTCVRNSHTLAITPTSTQFINKGASAQFTLTLTNNDSTACTPSTYKLLTSGQMSWLPAKLDKPTVVVGPGASATIVLTVSASSAAPVSLYSVTVNADNTTVSNTPTATVTANVGINS